LAEEPTVSTPLSDSTWLNDADLCPLEHLANVSGLSIEEVEDLVATDIIEGVDGDTSVRMVHIRHVVTVRKARRLRDDFELNQQGVALAMVLLRRIEVLEDELGRRG
jgi:chaperone modulatory protein CbpM